MNKVKKLFVIFKDGAVASMLRRSIELNDDLPSGEIIGVKDGSVEVVMCSEEMWNKRSKTSDGVERLLFIGTSKALNTMLPSIAVKFDQYGISYGWNDHVGLLSVDDSLIKDNNLYNDFCETFSQEFENPNARKVLDSINSDFGETSDYLHPELIKKRRKKKAGTATLAVLTGGLSLAALPVSSSIKKKQQIIQQMYFYGVFHFYLYHLEEFMKD